MAELNKDQQQFWDMLRNSYPDVKRCINCISVRGAMESFPCSNCDHEYSAWKWNGESWD